MAYTKYSLTPDNNNAAPPDGAPEGMLPSGVNNTMRDMMAQIRDVGDGIRDGTYAITNANITGGSISGITDLAIADGGTGASDASTARTNLGLAIGTNVQAYDPDLAAIAALTPTADNFIVGNGTTWILETPSQARTSLGATTLGGNLLTITNPSAVTFPRFNADNTVSSLSASDFRTAIGAGTGNGTVTSVGGTGTVNGLTLTGTVTGSGNLTLGGTLSGVSLTTQVSGTLPVANGGTGVTTSTGTGSVVLSNNPTFASQTNSGNYTFTGTGNRITGDMSNATHVNRLSFQSSVTNGATSPFIIPNGTGNTASIVVANASDPTNSSFGQLVVAGTTDVRLNSGTLGTGTALPLTMYTGGSERLRIDTSGNVGIGSSSPKALFETSGVSDAPSLTAASGIAAFTTNSTVRVILGGYTSSPFGFWLQTKDSQGVGGNGTGASYPILLNPIGGNVGVGTTNPSQRLTVSGNAQVDSGSIRLTRVAVAASDINLNSGNYFTRTISGTTTFTVSNVPTSGTAISFILDLTNGGSATVNWWTNVKWAGGTAPTLTSSGRDVLGFYTHDGGTNWNGLLLARDIK